MANTNVVLTAGTLPEGYCFSTLQQYYNDIISLTLAQIPGTYSLFTYGPNIPDPADQDKPWIRTLSDGSFDRLYTYNGVWCSPHPTPFSSSERRMWVGSEADLWAYDGGDGSDPATSPPTDSTGAMWAVDTAFAFRMPLGVGTNPVSYNGEAATAAAVTDTGGVEKHALTEAELAEHSHLLANSTANTGTALSAAGEYIAMNGSPGGDADFAYGLSPSLASAAPDVGKVAETGDGEAHPNMPPYYTVYFIKRSARKYYTVT